MEQPPAPRIDPLPAREPGTLSSVELAVIFGLALMTADALSIVMLHEISGRPMGPGLARVNATIVLGRGGLDALALGALDAWWRRRPHALLVRRLCEAFVAAYAVCVLFQTAEVLHANDLGLRMTFGRVAGDWTTFRFAFAVWGLSLGFALAILLRERPFLAGLGFAVPRWFTDDLVTYVLEGRSTSVPASESGLKVTAAFGVVVLVGLLVLVLAWLVPLAFDALGIHTQSEPQPRADDPELP